MSHIKYTHLLSPKLSHPNIHFPTSQVNRTVTNNTVGDTEAPDFSLAIFDVPKIRYQYVLYARSQGVNLRTQGENEDGQFNKVGSHNIGSPLKNPIRLQSIDPIPVK